MMTMRLLFITAYIAIAIAGYLLIPFIMALGGRQVFSSYWAEMLFAMAVWPVTILGLIFCKAIEKYEEWLNELAERKWKEKANAEEDTES